MKYILTFMLVIYLSQFCCAVMKVSDFYDQNGSAIIFWKDMNVEQKTQSLEWERENAEYILKNLDKKCSELKNIPEYTRLNEMHSSTIPPRTFGPNDICFPSSPDTLIVAYRTLGDNEKNWLCCEVLLKMMRRIILAVKQII